MSNSPIFSPSIPKVKDEVVVWSGLTGCADALTLASAINNTPQLFVIITPDSQTALRLEHELAFFLATNIPLLHFPDWETLPYDVFSPLSEIISERLKTLALLPEVKRGALILSATTLMHRLAPREHVLANSFSIKVGDVFNLELNRIKLESVGYQCVSQVYQHAEFAVRGAIVDLFPMGSKVPFRIELFDDEVESIRTFDPESQRSLEKIDQIQLFPAREFPFTDESIKLFRQAFRTQFPESSPKNTLYLDISKGITPNGIEYYLPLFVEQTATLFEYLPKTAVLVVAENINATATEFYAEAEERYEQRKYDLDRPLLKPEQLFLSANKLTENLSKFARITLSEHTIGTDNASPCLPLPQVMLDIKSNTPAANLQSFIDSFAGKILFVSESAGRREALIDRLRINKISVKVVENWQAFLNSEVSPCIIVAPMENGICLKNPALAIITESQLSGEKVLQRRRRKQSATKELENIINNLNELTMGSAVVHRDHGVGRYLGLQTLQIGGITSEFLTLEYANNDKLYVPVSTLYVIGRYTGMNPDEAPLHKLGGEQWSKLRPLLAT